MNPPADIVEGTAAIEMRGVAVNATRDPGTCLAESVDWTVATGDFWVIAGPQRGGKTDFLMMAGGMGSPAAGRYRAFGEEMPIFEDDRLRERLGIGFVFEGGILFNQMTIAENVALPLRFHENLSQREARPRIEKLLELLDLTALADRIPTSVAWNWQKRAGLARALAMRPRMLLLDNPLSGLSPRDIGWWLGLLDQLNRGHEWMEGKPLTIVASADDFLPWRQHARQFACLVQRQLKVLGDWQAVMQCPDPPVKELLHRPAIDGADGI